MQEINLTKEQLADLGITNGKQFEAYKNAVNDVRRKNGMEEYKITADGFGVSEMMQNYINRQNERYKAQGVDVGISDEEAKAEILRKYPRESGISDGMRSHLERQYKNQKF